MKEKSLEFKKDVYLAIFKALLTLLILDFSGVASILYKEGIKATPWVIIGSATAVILTIFLIWSGNMIFLLAEQLERDEK